MLGDGTLGYFMAAIGRIHVWLMKCLCGCIVQKGCVVLGGMRWYQVWLGTDSVSLEKESGHEED